MAASRLEILNALPSALRNGLIRDYEQAMLKFGALESLLPTPDPALSKNPWEKNMLHAGTILRLLRECDDTRHQAGCQNYFLSRYEDILDVLP